MPRGVYHPTYITEPMDIILIAARILHIGLGVFWAGTIFFFVFLLEPSVRSVGPQGGLVMMALQRRKFMIILPVAAGLTILSGIYLYWRVSGGFALDWISAPIGEALTLGSVTSIVAFVIGVFFMRPAALEVGRLSASLANVNESEERDAISARIEDLKSRSRTYARWVAICLGVAVITMAVARYL